MKKVLFPAKTCLLNEGFPHLKFCFIRPKISEIFVALFGVTTVALKKHKALFKMENETYTVLPSLFIDEVKHLPGFGDLIKRQKTYPKNVIRTTKYTVWNFLPLNIFEQLHRFANLYFISLCIYNYLPQGKITGKYLTRGRTVVTEVGSNRGIFSFCVNIEYFTDKGISEFPLFCQTFTVTSIFLHNK